MIRYRREELMLHPLCTKYLQTKWYESCATVIEMPADCFHSCVNLFLSMFRNAYGMYFHLINLAIYTVFLAALTIASISLMAPETNRSFVPPLFGYNWFASNETTLSPRNHTILTGSTGSGAGGRGSVKSHDWVSVSIEFF